MYWVLIMVLVFAFFVSTRRIDSKQKTLVASILFILGSASLLLLFIADIEFAVYFGVVLTYFGGAYLIFRSLVVLIRKFRKTN